MPPPADKLRARAVRGTAWQLAAKAVRLVLELGVLAVLSRLVTPREFGLVAIAMIFVHLAALFYDAGVKAAIVQRPALDDRIVRTAFTVATLAGIGFTALALLLAPLVAALFDAPAVTPVLRLLAAGFVLVALGLVSKGLLWRRMDFRALALIETAAYLVGYGAVACLLAWRGLGVWALVWGSLTQHLVSTLLSLAWARHPLKPLLAGEEARYVYSYSSGVMLNRLFNLLAKKADYFVVGRWLGPGALGFYQRAFSLVELPSAVLSGVIAGVSFPAMSRLQEDTARLGRLYLRTVGLIATVYVPGAVVLWAAAPPLVRLLFGPEWLPTVAPMRVLCFALPFMASYPISDGLIRARAAVFRSAWRVGAYAVVLLAGALVGKRWGVEGVAVAVALAVAFKYLLVARLSLDVLGLGWRDYLRCQLPGALLGAATAAGLAALGAGLAALEAGALGAGALPPWAELAAIAAAAALLLTALALALPARWLGDDLFWALDLVRGALPRRVALLERIAARRTATTTPGSRFTKL